MTGIIKLLPKNTNDVIEAVAKILRDGGLVVFPSDTVYGLLVDATNEKAVQKLIAFKNRAPGKAVSIFVSDIAECERHAYINHTQKLMLSDLLPGPFTMVLSSKHTVQKELEAENGTVGMRIPNYFPLLSLARIYGSPITATSANLGGKSPHYSIESLTNQLPTSKYEQIDLIVDAGKLPLNKPSTVIDLTQSTLKILREGDVIVTNAKIEKLTSQTSEETRKIGESIIKKIIAKKNQKPIVIVLKGDLGSGKTEMTRGIAQYLGIQKIVSPTYVVYYEYDILKFQNSKSKFQTKKFIHVDLYNIQEEAEFKHLGLESYLKPGNIMVVEWGEKLGKMYERFSKKANVVHVNIEHLNENERKITIRS
ncbi:MAG: L-threonylcarbamoyladenylate synthase [Candidatus Roizmanbacteria bacterium]|nr:L-threonylcarbamoyladenylate synthase [Candidatus Roizmanbacteria bacterium]